MGESHIFIRFLSDTDAKPTDRVRQAWVLDDELVGSREVWNHVIDRKVQEDHGKTEMKYRCTSKPRKPRRWDEIHVKQKWKIKDKNPIRIRITIITSEPILTREKKRARKKVG